MWVLKSPNTTYGSVDGTSSSACCRSSKKRFGRRVYIVGESVVLTAGWETPQGNKSKQRGEGVTTVLSKEAVTAWKAGGEQWNAWGSRIVKVSLGSGKGSSSRIHILSCYAPPFAASRDDKDHFVSCRAATLML